MARLLIVLGVVLVVLAILMAFTIYGEISGLLGVGCFAAGLAMAARRRSHPATGARGDPAGPGQGIGSLPPERAD